MPRPTLAASAAAVLPEEEEVYCSPEELAGRPRTQKVGRIGFCWSGRVAVIFHCNSGFSAC